ncbi:hypothetical protein [Streptomyces sp. NPDC058249]|uniref:hypothetical protein n=1 Tax=Streptomyces sp. NPDC058249 TaxID=3346403 RepID=UPI0036E567CB
MHSSPTPHDPIRTACAPPAAPPPSIRSLGTPVQPQTPCESPRLTVDDLEVLDTPLIPILRDMAMDRYGNYLELGVLGVLLGRG